LGIQRELGAKMARAVDGVWAEGYHLLAGHDLNYPDLDDTVRPRLNPNLLVIQAYETRGNSWYKALQTSIKRQHANRYSYFVAYTLSNSERDTEDFRFVPQEQRDYAADRGPGAKRFPPPSRGKHDGRTAICFACDRCGYGENGSPPQHHYGSR
jgi:hypothetical protein